MMPSAADRGLGGGFREARAGRFVAPGSWAKWSEMSNTCYPQMNTLSNFPGGGSLSPSARDSANPHKTNHVGRICFPACSGRWLARGLLRTEGGGVCLSVLRFEWESPALWSALAEGSRSWKEGGFMEEQNERQRYEKPELERLDGLQTVAAQPPPPKPSGCGCGGGS